MKTRTQEVLIWKPLKRKYQKFLTPKLAGLDVANACMWSL